MAKQNAINNKSSTLTIDPGASGDSYVQFDINTTGKFRIGVDDTDDSFCIALGSALGTNDAFKITDSGERTLPLQPSFFRWFNTSSVSNVTGDGTIYNVSWPDETYDTQSNMTATTFTAPTTGVYILIATVFCYQPSASMTNDFIYFTTTTKDYRGWQGSSLGTTSLCLQASAIEKMTAADTASFYVRFIGGSKTVDILNSANRVSYISGQLIG